MKKILMIIIPLLFTTFVLADVRITVSKGDASLCEVIPAKSKKSMHYNKTVHPRELSSDLWQSARKGLGFFHLAKSEVASETSQLAFVDKYSTFWYYTKKGSDVKGIYNYDFIVPEQKNYERIFVDIELENKMPCSCFLKQDRPSRCQKNYRSSKHNRHNNFQLPFYDEALILYQGKLYTIKKFENEFGRLSH